MNAKGTTQLINWVRAKLNQWDPIGVACIGDDEYDSYAPKIAQMLWNGADAYRISEHLTNIETVAMGLRGDPSRVQAVAEALVKGFQKDDFTLSVDG